MNLSLSDTLRAFVDAQAADRGFETGDDYVLELILREQNIERLRAMIVDGADSGVGRLADQDYFDALRARARGDAAE